MNKILIRNLGLKPYEDTWKMMREFTDNRHSETVDEVWLVQHFPVFTQGQAGKPEHLLNTNNNIPVVQSDRGGQVTYHGPGQLVVYTLLDIKRKNMGIRLLVSALENAMINLLAEYGIQGKTRCNAPGVYVENAKIGSVGLRIRRGYCYHGLSLNVDMDLTPFESINPCGYSNLKVVQMKDFHPDCIPEEVSPKLLKHLTQHLNCQV